jgi:hypothetical protein
MKNIIKKSTVKKAQKGATVDSTAYYNKLAKSQFDEWRKARASNNKDILYNKEMTQEKFQKKVDKENEYYKKANEAVNNSLRQSRKGKRELGYDKMGFPIKKQRSGGKITKKISKKK